MTGPISPETARYILADLDRLNVEELAKLAVAREPEPSLSVASRARATALDRLLMMLDAVAAGVVDPPKAALSNFGLEAPQAIEPERLVGRGPYAAEDGFFLSLALIFNDVKGLIMHERWLAPHRPLTETPTPFLGQWSGLIIQLRRLVAGVVWELCELIKAHREIVENAAFTGLLSRLPKESRAAWFALEDLAFERDKTTSALAEALKRIRHNGAFHYYQPEDLVAGYRRAFYEEPESSLNRRALASVGQDMEGTRFYYADAAAGALMTRAGEEKGIVDFREQLANALEVVNLALASVVTRHLVERRDGGLAPRPPLQRRGGMKRNKRRRQ